MNKRGKIKIELRSNLCVSSGYSYAGIIDNDICYDKCGLPYIPSRRLKGCMRETAESLLYHLVTQEMILKLFGDSFQSGAKGETEGIIIDNARLEGYENMFASLNDAIKSKKATRQEILNLFTTVYAQTKLKEGVAEEGTLRYTRAVNRWFPLTKESLVFYADIIYPQEEEKILEQILQATRHIGLKRNRGFGNVRCTLSFEEKSNDSGKEKNIFNSEMNMVNFESFRKDKDQMNKSSGEQLKKIFYTIKNIEPLMLSENSDNSSSTVIRGQRVLGILASRYLKIIGNTPEDNAFYNLFLDGTTIYSDLRPSFQNMIYYPSPLYFNKLKKSKKIVNTEYNYDEEWINDENLETYRADYNPNENGNIPKKIKNEFLAFVDEQVFLHSISQDIIYHHSKGKDDNSGILYPHKAIMENQTFSGFIILPEKYADYMKQLLKKEEMRFGKSITAQYGKCRLEAAPVDEVYHPENKQFEKGTYIIVTLLSDGIFLGDDDYTVDKEELFQIIANQLGIESDEINHKSYTSMIQTKIIYGYQSKWNLRKPPIPGVKAGSAFVYKLKETLITNKEFIGERNLEGYGQIRIDNLADMSYVVKETEVLFPKAGHTEDKRVMELLREIERQRQLNKCNWDAVKKVDFLLGKKVSASTIGRIALMLKESVESCKNDDKEKAYDDFKKRINSIKRTEVKKIAIKLLEEAEKFKNEYPQIKDCWNLYLMTMLVNAKYEKKGETE